MAEPNQISFRLAMRVKDQEVSPQNIGFSQFNQFNSEVETFVAGSQRRAQLDEVRVEIREGSYNLLLTLPALLLGILEPDLRKLDREDSLSEIDPKQAEVMKQWQKRARNTPGFQVEINSNGLDFRPISVTKETDYRTADEDDWVAVEKYLVGTVVDMGGVTAANVHLVNDDTNKTFVAASNESFLREQKENFLYRKVQAHVAAIENIKTAELKDVRLLSFIGSGPSYDEAELEAAIDKGTKAWAGISDPGAWLRSIREGENE